MLGLGVAARTHSYMLSSSTDQPASDPPWTALRPDLLIVGNITVDLVDGTTPTVSQQLQKLARAFKAC
jgi:hypothetical protein